MSILVIGILLILYGFVSKMKYSVQIGMLFVLLIMGLQEGIPGDFMEYKYMYTHGGAVEGSSDTIKLSEYSFIGLTQFCSQFMSFHWFVFLTTLFQCLVMGAMIKDYADKRYWSFGVLLIFFTYNIMLIQMKAMRQGYAVECLYFAYWLLGRWKLLFSIIMAFIAYGFHNSTLIVFPLFFVLLILMLLKQNNKKTDEKYLNDIKVSGSTYKYAFISAGGLIIFTILKFTVIDSYIKPITDALDFFEYGGYFNQMEENKLAWWIVLYNSIATFASMLYYKNESNLYRKYLAFISVVGCYVYVGLFGMGSLFRVSMFFDIFSIVTYPNIAGMLKNTYGKKIAGCYVVFILVYQMYLSVIRMLSMDSEGGYGYGMYEFCF